MRYDFREMRLDETKAMIRYFLKADRAFLRGMGIDPNKLPAESTWFELLRQDFALPLQQKHFYYLVWEDDGVTLGHCNINKIAFGDAAYLHLHIWNANNRRLGCATHLLKPSIVHFFERFELRELFCEPYASNPAPNKTLPKVGFRLVKTYQTTPGWINFHQPVNRWVLDRQSALQVPMQPKTEIALSAPLVPPLPNVTPMNTDPPLDTLPIPTEAMAFGQVRLRFVRVVPGDPARDFVPAYHFRILDADDSDVGHINFRVGDTEHVRLCAGHIGFEIREPFRGHGYAFQACRALAPFIRSVYEAVTITCDPDNVASRRTIERLGATFVDEVAVPTHDEHHRRGSRRKRCYRWTL